MGSLLSSQLHPCSSAGPAATVNSQWMLLAPYGGGTAEGCNISRGHRISVSLRHEPFSSLSRICLCFLPGTAIIPWACSTVIAAHGGSVLLKINWREGNSPGSYSSYFVYNNVGAAAPDPARPPSLYLLQGPYQGKNYRPLDISATGLLCRGEAEFVVAELTVVGCQDDAAEAASLIAFELRLFRHGEWCVKRPWFIYGNGMNRKELWAQWETIAVVPLGNGMLCWVDWYSGVIFSDVLEEGPNMLRYVLYPPEAVMYQRFICTDVRGALKLVSISPHHCCHCSCSEHATDIDIWTLNTDDMAWILETETNMVDPTELWMIPDTPGYARAHLVYPVASMNGGSHVVASKSSGGDNVSDQSAAPMEEEDENTRLSVSTPSATASIHDRLQRGPQLPPVTSNRATMDQLQWAGGPRGAGGPIRW